MGNAITTDRADGLRDLAWKALSLLTSTTDRIIGELGDDAPSAIAAAIAKTEHDLRPVPQDEAQRAAWGHALDERLRRLAAKVAPTAAPAQTVEWRSSMVDALSDLPAMISLTAAKKAIHRPFRFIGDIEAAVREIATEVLAEREARLRALRRMQADLARAMAPAPALPPAADAHEITPAMIRAMTPDFRRMGLKAGYITQAEIDDALGLDANGAEQVEQRAAA